MTTIIGVDISKSKFDVRYLPDNTYQTHENTQVGIQAWLKELKQRDISIIALENTGGYEKLLVKLLHEAGLPVHIAAGDKIRYFARYRGYLGKTDKQEKIARYETVKGIGEVTARQLVIYLPELGEKDRAEIAALAGVAPINKDSGTKRGYRRTLAGRPVVKRALYMAALVASRFNPVLKQFYDKLIQKGKAPKIALMALMRKLVLILNAMQEIS